MGVPSFLQAHAGGMFDADSLLRLDILFFKTVPESIVKSSL